MPSTSGRPLSLLALLSVLALLASIPGQSAGPAGRGGGGSGDGGLRVVFTLPSGAVDEAPSVDVLFDRPMRVLGDERRGDEEKLLLISPPVEGRRHWIGSRALRFVPDHPLPRATTFTATFSPARSTAVASGETYQLEPRVPATPIHPAPSQAN